MHNVFQLSEQILSGSEPHGDEAFAELERRGIRTVLSVDGSNPDLELAGRHGLRYVHVPIQYKGIAGDEILRIAKTFRELDGPFYVHCFHGKHRGPAAAAVGRCVLDGAPRDRAIAEMRQWMGTSEGYEGLYQTIATQAIPDAETTAAYAYDFPSTQPLEGFAAGMSALVRARDALKHLAKRDFGVDPAHPDVSPRNEAKKLHGYLLACRDTYDYETGAEDFRGWLDKSITDAATLADLFAEDSRDAARVDRAGAVFGEILDTCKRCHAAYRN